MYMRRLLIVMICSLTALITASCSDDSSGPAGSGISMDEAIDIVIDDIIPAELPQGGKYVCLRMSGSIPKGSTIEEAMPSGWQASMSRSSYASFTEDEESYFFFLDLDPASFYEHPVKYIVVEKSSGSFGVTDAKWWPKVNGETPSQFLATVPDADYVVEDTANLPAPIEEEMTFPFGDLNLIWKEGFIVVQGLMPDEKCYDCAVNTYQNGMNFFNAYKNSFSRIEGLQEAQADNVPAVIDDMVAEGIDLITIYIIAHGNYDIIGLAGHAVVESTFRFKMAEHSGVLFNFLLGSCHSAASSMISRRSTTFESS
jgi:hypothetical protein